MSDHPLVVIGAGPAGLSAAIEATKIGIRPLVVEKSGRPGGLARTETHKGFRFDIGGHRYFSQIPEVEDFWREMLGEDLLRVCRLSRIHY